MEGTLGRLRKRVGELLFEETGGIGQSRRTLVYLLRMITYLVQQLIRDNSPQRAAALAYTTILSLVPVTALFFTYFKVAGKLDAFQGPLQEWILQMFLAESARGIIVYINTFVENLHTRTIGTIGAAGLIFVAYSLLRTIEKSLNAIWDVRKHRSFWARFQLLSTLLVVVPTFFMASLYLSGRVEELKMFGHYAEVTALMRMLFLAAPFLLTAIPIFVLYKIVPNTHVRWRPALVAALVAAILFEISKWGFNLYVTRVIPLSKIYGSLGLIPLLLLWIYFCWIIVLFGVELAYTMQNLRRLHEEALETRTPQTHTPGVHEDWGLHILVALTKCFSRSKGPVPPDLLMEEINLPMPKIEDHLEVLAQGRWIGWIEDEERSGYVLLRPADQIRTAEIVDAFRTKLGLPSKKSDELPSTILELVNA